MAKKTSGMGAFDVQEVLHFHRKNIQRSVRIFCPEFLQAICKGILEFCTISEKFSWFLQTERLELLEFIYPEDFWSIQEGITKLLDILGSENF